jgi:hypothetical protein
MTDQKMEEPMTETFTPEEASKDDFFRRLAEMSEEMVAKHGKDFSMGALILAARWIAADGRGHPGQPNGPELVSRG